MSPDDYASKIVDENVDVGGGFVGNVSFLKISQQQLKDLIADAIADYFDTHKPKECPEGKD